MGAENHVWNTDPRTAPRYDIATAARMADINGSRARRWLKGYAYKVRGEVKHSRPVVRRDASAYASFLDVIEMTYAKEFLREGVSLQKIKAALEEAKAYAQSDHPFARRRFYVLNAELFLDIESRAGEASLLLHLLRDKQLAMPAVIRPMARRIEFDVDGVAERWWPKGRRGQVLVDPDRNFGSPILAKSGVSTAAIYDLYLGEGRRADAVAKWMRIPVLQVQAAVRYEKALAEAA